MSTNVKYRPTAPVTGWLEYHLVTIMLDPPVFRCRLKPVDMFNLIDGVGPGGFKLGRATIEAVIEAVEEWDLAVEGAPIPCTDENKAAWLRPIIAEQVADRPDGMLLGVAMLVDARNKDNFLKN